MAGNVNDAMTQGDHDFEYILKPRLQERYQGRFESVELQGRRGNLFAKHLDVVAGVDAFHLFRDGALDVIDFYAVRIQRIELRPSGPFDTFTIRQNRESGAATEYQKRACAIEQGYVYPFYTIQAYVNQDTSKLLSFARVETRHLFALAGLKSINARHTGQEQVGQASFLYVRWGDVSRAGYPIDIVSFGRNK